jgi:uncharacterized protein (TIGR00299 family) protein
MSRVLFLESVAGVAGDMFAASFVDAGLVSAEELAALPGLLGLEGVRVEATRTSKATMAATRIRVVCPPARGGAPDHVHGEPHAHHGDGGIETHLRLEHRLEEHGHTHHADIDRMFERSGLEPAVREGARRIFRLLAEAEAAAHGTAVERVAFHEVGTADSILDAAMAATCVARVGAARIVATPVKAGRGLVRMAHGTHPVPPPASARLLVGMPVDPVPEAISRRDVELSTPTGLAILKALAPEFRDSLPAGRVLAQGMGAGTMDLGAYPNVFRVTLLEEAGAAGGLPYERDRVWELACNIDDDTGERIGWLAEQLMARGALDAWISPVTGKKGRPAVVLSALAREDDWQALADWILRQSTTFGVRYRPWDRLKLSRRFERRETPLGPVSHKIGLTTAGEVLKEKPEFEDLRRGWESRRPGTEPGA